MKKSNKRRYVLMEGVDPETEIYQYMDLDYLLSLLEKRKYHVNKKCVFLDKYESKLPVKAMFRLKAVGGEMEIKQPEEDTRDILERRRKYEQMKNVLTSCWTERDTESFLMWTSYSTKIGVCIKSTISNFVAAFDADDYRIWCGRVMYKGYNANQTLMESLFSKEKAFEDEREIRFYFKKKGVCYCNSDSNFIEIPINPNVMIDKVILSPRMEPLASRVLSQFLHEKYKINVSLSKILLK